jgi:signal transduction histidine kinase
MRTYPEAPPFSSGQGRNSERSQAFRTYRLWVCANLGRLMSGEPEFWDRFSHDRSFLITCPEPIRSRFAWERPFLSRNPLKLPVSVAQLVNVYHVSRDGLRQCQRAGVLRAAGPAPGSFDMHQIKRLQWLLFFSRELGLRIHAISALLSLEEPRRQFEILARSSTLNLPVHESLPAASQRRRKGVDWVEATQYTDVRAIRDLIHELGNKLHVIAGRADRLRRKLPENELAEKNLSIILDQSEMATRTLGELRNLFLANQPVP